MADTVPIRVYEPDKKLIEEIANEQGVKRADVVAEMIEEQTGERHVHECPECEEVFDIREVDPETIREHGVLNSDMRLVVRGQRSVKDFECPCCNSTVQPGDLDMKEPASPDDVSEVDSGSDASEEPA